MVTVSADVRPRTVADQILNGLKADALPDLVRRYPGLRYSFEGRQRDLAESLDSLGKGFALAMIAIYAMLAIPFKSYFQPLIIMVSIPFGIVGAILGHILMNHIGPWITGEEVNFGLSIMSMMGIVALSGVVVNDSLVLIEYANRQRQDGLSAHDAIVIAGIRRFRPIMLTSLTTFGGLAPMIFETSMQARFLIPMAISLGFGILFATGIALALVPCLFMMIEDAHNAPKAVGRGLRKLFGAKVDPPQAQADTAPLDAEG